MGDDSISLDAQARKCDSDNYFPPAFATGQITQVDHSGNGTSCYSLNVSDVDKWDNETAVDGNSDKDDNGLDNAEEEDTSKGVVDKSSSEEDNTEDGDGLSTGAIIGIVIAVVAVPLAIVYFGQRRRQQLQNQEELARN